MPIRAEPKDLATEKDVNQELRWKPLKYFSKSYGRPDDKKLRHHCHDGDGNDHENLSPCAHSSIGSFLGLNNTLL